MTRRNRIILAGAAALALVAFASPQHRASIQILAHDQGDVSPRRIQAVVDLGLVGVSVLVTWSRRLAY
ncbi:hypothetical protein [Sphingomonas hengshuiensis]|uniref:Uncharacterized protein n=1 Tax=Sphingomonas hengshuiensis TaxID=1609977 RepID=A0A7U4LG61_9SPHN|nr:hypothetical protein [Sphingomonas hengshuiensis]AJP72973.1 hypothetical protein TS85_16000 [Sphingomonas hengshuiensis]